jgi:hypothetical protein
MAILTLKNERIINTAILILFLISISLITYDNLPFLHYSSYSPSSIFTFLIAFILTITVGFKYQPYDKWLITFIAISIIHSLVSGVYYDDVVTSIKHIITLLVGLSVFTVVRFSFIKKKQNNRLFENVLMLSMLIPLLTGYMQLLSQMGANVSVIRTITSFFVVQVYDGRIQMASSEPSWASIHLLTIFVIILFKKAGRFRKIFLASTGLLFFLTFSSFGYGVLLFSFVLYGLITRKYRFKMLALIAVTIFVIFIIVPWTLNYFNVNSYFNQRFNLNYLLSSDFLASDASGFVRIVFPVIGLLEFLGFPFGYGGGFYHIHFKQYLMEYFSYGLVHEEVMGNITGGHANPMNFFAKILSEEGLISFILMVLFLRGIFKQCKSNYSKYIFCLALSFLLNFDSYAFVNFWFLIGIIASGYFNGDRDANLSFEDEEQLNNRFSA